MYSRWYTTLQQIRQLLEQKQFRRAVSAELTKLKSTAPEQGDIACHYSHCLDSFSPEESDLNRLLSVKARVRTSTTGLGQIVLREIIEKLPQPTIIVKEDVLESMAEHLVGTADQPSDQAFEQFVHSVLGCLAPPRLDSDVGVRQSASMSFDFVDGDPEFVFDRGSCIAELPSGLYIICNQVVEYEFRSRFRLFMSVCGVSSARALTAASSQCFEILRSIAPRLCQQAKKHLDDGDFNSMIERSNTMESIVRARVQQCFSIYFGAESAKMTFQGRRIRNAVQLLIESDRQSHHAIGLALSFAAIESLLGEKTQGIGEDIAVKAATLLCPDAEHRRGVINIVKKMYDHRSRSLHGEQLMVEAETRERVRMLASTVLRAVLDWLEFSVRLGNTQAEAPQFFKALQYATDTGKRFVGPSDDLGATLDWFKE